MTELQAATDYIAIIFMGFILILLFISIIAAFVMKHKVKKMKKDILMKFELIRNIPYIGKRMFSAAKKK